MSDIQSPASSGIELALIARMARGDRAALGDLYDLHAPRVMAVALRVLQNREQAEDLVHEVLLEAWRHAAEYDASRGSVLTWLLLRTRSRALDVRRSQNRAVGAAANKAVTDDGASDPIADAERIVDRSKAVAALRGVSVEELQVIVLAYFEGLSSSEIAERVGVPVGTVKSRTRSALLKLRDRMGVRGGLP
jgi:RNA polymerase sigma-70 factor (ECF subfamily)